MNFKKIFGMQKELDKAICAKHNINHLEVKDKRIVALLVEVSEFANEYAPFKYWKVNKIIDRSKVLEEFVDGIHFFSSLAIEVGLEENPIINSNIVSNDLTEQLLATFKAISNLSNELSKETLKEAFSIYMGNARLLDISNQEIEEFYVNKNKVNYERIANNY